MRLLLVIVLYRFVFSQQRFTVGSSVDAHDTDNPEWFVRLSFTTDKDKNFDPKSAPSVWLVPEANETIVSIAHDVQWYIFDVQSTGEI